MSLRIVLRVECCSLRVESAQTSLVRVERYVVSVFERVEWAYGIIGRTKETCLGVRGGDKVVMGGGGSRSEQPIGWLRGGIRGINLCWRNIGE
eukprot:scaffold13912_cov648-Alexandrium_tamarense.AAC.1